MKNIVKSIALLAMCCIVCSCEKCDYSNVIDKLLDLEKRVARLEELCKQLNTDIFSLNKIVQVLESNDFITNVAPVYKDGITIGYTISFSQHQSITIYNGKDGNDGYVPIIGVKKDVDGCYYWTIDGEWLLDNEGMKIRTSGSNGINGVTPQLQIVDDYWYISYDEGVSWTKLGKSKGDDGVDMEGVFSSVTQDEEYVYFELLDGTIITLVKQNKDNILFEDLIVKKICCINWDINKDGELSYEEAKTVTSLGGQFSGNDKIVAFNELKYFTSLTEIPSMSFSGCENLWKIILPTSVSVIRERAFYNCTSLAKINIPDNVCKIEDLAFYGCKNISLVEIHSLVNWCNIEFVSEWANPLYNSADISIDGQIISELQIPEGVTDINKYTFICSKSIKNIIFSNSIRSINESSFSWNYNLETIVLGNAVQWIGSEAFTGCTNLTTVYNKANVPPIIGSNVFYINSQLKIYVPQNAIDTYRQSNYWNIYSNYLFEYNYE